MNDKKPKPNYYSVIPAEVRYCKALGNASPRDIYGEITALCNKQGYCFASNGYFAELYEVDPRTIRRWIALLEKEGFIYIKAGKQRRIFLAHKTDPGAVEDIPEPKSEGVTVNVKNVKKVIDKAVKKVNKKQKYTDHDLYLAELLLSKIIYNFPTFENKKVKISDWADDIRLLREIEKASAHQIEFMITWVQGGEFKQEGKPPRTFPPHEFWDKNILSTTKLRKQWFTLVPQLQAAFKKEVKKTGAADLRSKAKPPVASTQRAARL